MSFTQWTVTEMSKTKRKEKYAKKKWSRRVLKSIRKQEEKFRELKAQQQVDRLERQKAMKLQRQEHKRQCQLVRDLEFQILQWKRFTAEICTGEAASQSERFHMLDQIFQFSTELGEEINEYFNIEDQ